MSLVSIYANKNIVEEKIKEFYGVFDEHYDNDILVVGGKVISDCLLGQIKMMRENLNKNTVNKRYFDKSFLVNKLLINTYYQHIYMHNHIAYEDEVYESEDAFIKKRVLKNDMCKLLLLEELIDIFHFILEYTCILEEHFLINMYADFLNSKTIDFNVDHMYDSLTTNKNFYKNIYDLLQREGTHIMSHVLKQFNPKDLKQQFNLNISELNRINREFIRNCNFKDWKNYPEDFYGPGKFSELIDINRNMYIYFFRELIKFVKYMNCLKIDLPHSFENNNIMDLFATVYALYMTKREENIRRQKNDPRYTGKSTGEIVGDNLI